MNNFSGQIPVTTFDQPLFALAKAATLSMIKHGMEIIKRITSHLNPGQIPVVLA